MGNDTFILNNDNIANLAINTNDTSSIMRVDGGNGTDTLQFDGSGINLNFTAIADNRVKDIEMIDITGSGNNSLKLTYKDLLHLNDDNKLYVKGNSGDSVDITGAWSTGTATVDGISYNTYNMGGTAATDIWIQTNINVITGGSMM